jgi:hypothetical protein
MNTMIERDSQLKKVSRSNHMDSTRTLLLSSVTLAACAGVGAGPESLVSGFSQKEVARASYRFHFSRRFVSLSVTNGT